MEPETKLTTLSMSWRILAISLLSITVIILMPAAPAYLEPADHAGFALSFDGDSDRVELHETSQVFGSAWADTKSVGLWVKPTGSDQCLLDPANCDLIMSERPHWWGISIGEIDGQDKIWVWNHDGTTDAVGVDYTLNEWVHITLVHNGGMLRAYRNGIEVGSTPSGTTMRPDGGEDSTLYLGGIPSVSTDWTFSGELDEVRFWNVVRSTTAVQQDLFVSLDGDEPGLVAYYKMSDGSGTTLTDDTGSGWDGTLLADGSPQWITSTIPHDGGPTPTPTSTATPPSPSPTNTPTPTPTGTIPTSTPTPTATGTLPTPTAEPTDALIYLPLVNGH